MVTPFNILCLGVAALRPLLFVLLATAGLSAEQIPGFRGVAFGATVADVKKVEKSALSEENRDGLLYVDVPVGGMKMAAMYLFHEGGLFQGVYFNQARHADPEDHVKEFDAMDILLREKYGEPTAVTRKWINEAARRMDLGPGRAIRLGHLKYETAWNFGQTTIIHTLTSRDLETVHQVEYTDSIRQILWIESMKKKAKDDL